MIWQILLQDKSCWAAVGESKRYHTLEWLNYISTELHKSLGMFFNPTVSEEIKSKILTPLVMTRFAVLPILVCQKDLI
ncbi:glutathione S-transferase [Legionella pneumophila]|nr:glutathione S-transferase [Legionella pneumophila]